MWKLFIQLSAVALLSAACSSAAGGDGGDSDSTSDEPAADTDTDTDVDTDTDTDTDTDADTDADTDTDTDTDTDSDLPTAGSVSGYVLLQGQVDHSGVTVTLNSADKDTVTNDVGYFVIEDVPAGAYTVTATLSGYESVSSAAFLVTAGEETDVPPLTLTVAQGSMSGTVTLEGETDFGGIAVTVDGTSFATTTAMNGSWTLSDVPAGNYTVRAAKIGFVTTTATDQQVNAGMNTAVPPMELGIVRSSISGRVTLSDDANPGGVNVTATADWNPALSHSASTNSAGDYVINDVEPGMWTVEASKTDYLPGSVDSVYVQATSPTVGVDMELVAAPSGVAFTLQYVSGGSVNSDPPQSGVVNQALGAPFVVRVVDSAGGPVSNAYITYTIVANQVDGHMQTAGMVTTDSDGYAENTYILGKRTGTNQIRVQCLALQNQEVNFLANGMPDSPDEIAPVAGSLQDGVVGQSLGESLVVEVRDQFGNVCPGQNVLFTPEGDGEALPDEVVTDANGRATTDWILGTVMGIQTLDVECGVAIHQFTADADHDGASKLVIVGGNFQSGVNTTTLPTALQVKAQDQYGNPVDGVSVDFAVTIGGGTLNPSVPQVTGVNGLASVALTLTSVGDLEVTASAGALDAVFFEASSTTAAPHHFVLVSGGNQTGTVGKALSAPVVVRLEDNFNNPLAGYWVTFEGRATSGTVGTPTPTTVQTNSGGLASVDFTLGTLAGNGAQWVRASQNTVVIDVTQNPVADVPSSIDIVSGDDQAARFGEALADPLVVIVTDQFGNPVIGQVVSWTTDGATPAAATSVTDSAGIASMTVTLDADPTNADQEITATAGAVDILFVATATGHFIEWLDPWIVWPGWEGDVTILGGGFEAGAMVVFDVGGAGELRLTPISILPDRVVFHLATAQTEVIRTLEVTVENPGPVVCAPTEFEVAHGVSDTGQTQCTTGSNWSWSWVDCATILPGDPLYGQDGHFTRPVHAETVPRGNYDVHILEGERVVRDLDSGLMWQGCSAGQSGENCDTGSASTMKWEPALVYCSNLDWGGYTDWKLPDMNELQSLVVESSSKIDLTAFPATVTTWPPYWSSSSFAYNGGYAWYVDFNYGDVNVDDKGDYYHVRCVRGGP